MTTEMIYLKDTIHAQNVTVGDYTYYAKDREEEDFERDNILYNVSGHGRLEIGKFCSLANGIEIIMGAANHSIRSFSSYPFNLVKPEWRNHLGMTREDMPNKGDTVIGNDVWIGQKATIMPGVTIGNGAVIGSKAVVAKNIPPYAIAVGNPARVIKYRFDEETIAFLEKLKWWNFSEEQLNSAIPYLTSVHLEEAKEELMKIKQEMKKRSCIVGKDSIKAR